MNVIDLNEELTTVTWCVGDLKEVFSNHNIPFTQENIDIFLNSRGCRTLHERSVEEGWEMLNIIISDDIDQYSVGE